MDPQPSGTRKVIPIIPQPIPAPATAPLTDSSDEVMVSLYAAHQKIYPRSVSGLFSNWRWGMVFLTQLVFYGLPWVEWGQRQAVLFDLGARRFYIFGLVLYPQDFIYLTGILVISALSLFLFTAVAGRLWCGYACPQTVYTEIFLWIEKKVEGDRSARMRRDALPLSADKLTRKGGKHLLWLALASWTGFTFVGYFTPIKVLGLEVVEANMGSWEVFWVCFYGFATYLNAGFMREQVCKYMCPYARFQSAMFDRDTLTVTYDLQRGEGRGARPRSDTPEQYHAKGLGDCIDCGLCVQVCPTGIDIRQGLQYECISCSGCIDVCDGVMDKMHYPRGLIRYSTENGVEQNFTRSQMIRRVFRPRVLVYSAVLGIVTIGMGLSLLTRDSFKVDVQRDRGLMTRAVGQGQIENVYRLQIMNATEAPQSYSIQVAGLEGATVSPASDVSVEAAGSRSVPVRVQAPQGMSAGSHPITFVVSTLTPPGDEVVEKSVFLVPR
mgnify:CR=1 FL=1